MTALPLMAVLLAINALPQQAEIAARQRAVTVVDTDLSTGTVTVTGPDRSTASAPGSTLKPMLLVIALRMGVITPQTRVACRGSLRVAGRNLTCAHPVSLGVLDAEEALAYSCNSYFARVAEQFSPAALHNGLQQFGLRTDGWTGSPERRILLALGLNGVVVTPVQLAHAYAELSRSLERPDSASETIRAGLLGSVVYCMAHAALTPGFVVSGKTGTAHDPAPMLQHGWFAGYASAQTTGVPATHVIVVYAPGGNGNDAAAGARLYLQSRRW